MHKNVWEKHTLASQYLTTPSILHVVTGNEVLQTKAMSLVIAVQTEELAHYN